MGISGGTTTNGRSRQEDVTRGKLRQAQNRPVTRCSDVSLQCASGGALALDQEPSCPNTNPARLWRPAAGLRFRIACARAARARPPPARWPWAKSVLSVLGTWERRWPQTSRPVVDE